MFSKEHLVCFTEVKVRDGVWYRHINNFPEVNYYIRVRVSATLCFTEARVRLKGVLHRKKIILHIIGPHECS